ncbi:hypothetical protein HZA39_00890 [Candidatus Peregrinibacteria bacterium]|nr:hypothetical protein [Candidatus Peregrinibacteria bacterium]
MNNIEKELGEEPEEEIYNIENGLTIPEENDHYREEDPLVNEEVYYFLLENPHLTMVNVENMHIEDIYEHGKQPLITIKTGKGPKAVKIDRAIWINEEKSDKGEIPKLQLQQRVKQLTDIIIQSTVAQLKQVDFTELFKYMMEGKEIEIKIEDLSQLEIGWADTKTFTVDKKGIRPCKKKPREHFFYLLKLKIEKELNKYMKENLDMQIKDKNQNVISLWDKYELKMVKFGNENNESPNPKSIAIWLAMKNKIQEN